MFFNVISHLSELRDVPKSRAYLVIDTWDDWFRFNTLYSLVIYDAHGMERHIGGVKIGQFGMSEDQRRPSIPHVFDALGNEFFSLGQDDSYYGLLNELGASIRDQVLVGLRDVARDLDLFSWALNEKVTGFSLLRSVTRASVRGQFHRLASGGARLSRYHFSFTAPQRAEAGNAPVSLRFDVEPESNPPSNIHVLIGRNGVGKTTFLNWMARSLVQENATVESSGTFSMSAEQGQTASSFANLVSVTFSAFDPFDPLPPRQDKSTGVQYSYIGLKSLPTDGKASSTPKTTEDLAGEFVESVKLCRSGARAVRWRRALEVLDSDPIFKDAELAGLTDAAALEEEVEATARTSFNGLSSGHKIVLLTLTRLVETVEERTLVLFDEPEAHLHPPLLAAFIRALSDLLIDRNGVAVVATHSPVVLQEVPKGCAWKIWRSGQKVVAERPEIETFGENVGVLTHEVFGLEVTHSGFHKLLQDNIDARSDYDAVLKRFGGALGGEALAILRALIAARRSQGSFDVED